jgi:hypothetical protein
VFCELSQGLFQRLGSKLKVHTLSRNHLKLSHFSGTICPVPFYGISALGFSCGTTGNHISAWSIKWFGRLEENPDFYIKRNTCDGGECKGSWILKIKQEQINDLVEAWHTEAGWGCFHGGLI